MDISPDKQNVDRLFSNTTYYIDFYQRDYRWTKTPVARLLDDIFYKFREQYAESKALDPGKEVIAANYPWYYLNTYVTNTVDGRVYVVDGQQRLTTLSLILIKLFHLAKEHESGLASWISSKIAGQSGYENEFWMNHVGHKKTQQQLFDEVALSDIDTESGITAINMVANFDFISKYLDKELKDAHALETFVFYFLHRLVLINLSVEQTDVSMVFEVINDRGVKLLPYEILKGKLLGQIDKIELDKGNFNDNWEERANAVNAFKDDELDEFFRSYLKSKYAATRAEGTKFDGDYHRAMFTQEMNEELELERNPSRVKSFLKDEFQYFTGLYTRLWAAYKDMDPEFRDVYNCDMLTLNAPFLLVLSACKLNDPDETEKIQTLSKEIDRYYSLLQLQNVYDSNEFNDSLFRISAKIRERDVDSFRAVFDEELTTRLSERRNVSEPDPFSYSAFKQTGISLNLRFKRYFFARVDQFLAENMNLNEKHAIDALVTKTGAKTGFHVEHILSRNDENLELFKNDEERFEQERNRLGGILLLKGKDNISSNNEPYEDKLKSYANTLYWNETLREDSYKSKLDMDALKKRHDLDLTHLDQFGPDEVEQRHKLLYEVAKIIWS